MIEKEYEGVKWLEFELLAEAPIVHGCFMRHGGFSRGGLQSLNLGKRVGDQPEHVKANFDKVSQALSFSRTFKLETIISARLSHGNDVTEICGRNKESIPISDGLMTQLSLCAIAVTQADCQAAIFYDPTNHALANVHCGWRGNVQNIYASTVNAMRNRYQTNPADLLVCISPSLGPEFAEFINHREELPEAFQTFQTKHNHFDFWAISEWQLKEAGVLSTHIQVARVDTYSSKDYFSHRLATHEGFVPCGRQATLCALL